MRYVGLFDKNCVPNIWYLVQKGEYLFACSNDGYVVKETRPGIHEAAKNGYQFEKGERVWEHVDGEEKKEIKTFLWPMVTFT